ncbi:hypothetical protein MNB_SV-3-794 [hydrothermal vent metagenome]|uniref:Cytochrome C n=1 Tax=hydrothermal vent metagenome TaxID=652676 RepID=A0A1W1CXC3_9ZZZZ
MKSMAKLMSITLLGMGLFCTSVVADAQKGQMVFLKKLKVSCGFNGVMFAQKHTQDEWEAIKGIGKFKAEILKFCPKAKIEAKYIPDIYDFVYEYAKDSDRV